ncbi:MAG: penicillin-binding protein 2 [Filomicrobium sp.]
MSVRVTIQAGVDDEAFRTPPPPGEEQRRAARLKSQQRADRFRSLAAIGLMVLAFLAVSGQLIRLSMSGQEQERLSVNAPMATAFARPDIVDRKGRLLAGDVVMPSLFADPKIILDVDEAATKLAGVLPDIDVDRVREAISDRDKRFVWLRRGLSPAQAQKVHDLGLPGLSFRQELRRAYPLGRLAGHVLGYVDIDNKGRAGIEHYLDRVKHVDAVHGASLSGKAPLRLTLDVAVQFAVEDELATALKRYKAKAASALVMDVRNGDIVAAVSLPGVDPVVSSQRFERARIDRLTQGTYELGSIFKTMTVALALEQGHTLETVVDVRKPLEVESYTIKDLHPAGRPLSVAEIFLKSSNVGSGLLALGAGQDAQEAFLERLGLLGDLATEAGSVAKPTRPAVWGEIETVTVSYGHGLAVSPLQFVAASAPLINGGYLVKPRFVAQTHDGEQLSQERKQVVSAETSRQIRAIMRWNVAGKVGTGSRADVPGLRLGGKTGTAEIAGVGGYQEEAVISSFLSAFPMDAPSYVMLVSLFEPQGTKETKGKITAGLNAAPTTARIASRIAPLLGFIPGPAVEAVVDR